MVHLHSCWSPCFWHNNVRDGSIATSIYTFFMSLCIITYVAYIMNGGDTSQLWLPFFETDLKSGLGGAGAFTISFFVVLALCSVLLCFGVWSSIRGLILPWQVLMGFVVLFQAIFGLWLICGYYIYLEVVFVALCDWLWMALNIYTMLVVRSHYRNVKMIQSPDIEYINY